MSLETPFKIDIPQAELDLLNQKLALTKFAPDVDTKDWDHGVPIHEIKRLVEYWKDGFDWRKSERALNEELPQFKRNVEVDGFGAIGIHYVHKKSDVPNAIPLLFIHGWPGSFYEGRYVIPLLTQGGKDYPSFHVVGVDLPNVGFSDRVDKRGFQVPHHAEAIHKLMLSLGYEQYVTQAGGWGFSVTRYMASKYGPKHVKAWHTNFPVPLQPTLGSHPYVFLRTVLSFIFPFTQQMRDDKKLLEYNLGLTKTELGYSYQQSTKPQTLGYGLADSPVGLLAWLYEKLIRWSDKYPWTDDQILEWITIYWFSTAGPHNPGRIYRENSDGGEKDMTAALTPGPTPTIPLGISDFPGEPLQFPSSWINTVGNIVFHGGGHTNGGHFPAYENPKGMADDVRKMFSKGERAYGVVEGKDGYSDAKK